MISISTPHSTGHRQKGIGQDRGVGALAFGLALDKDGFNVYVAGPSGSGRTTTVKTLVGREAASRPSASDWCYVHRFDSPSQPIAIRLPCGHGPELGRDLDELIAGCRREIPRVFEGEQYQHRRADIIQQLQNQREELLAQARGLAARLGFAVEFSPMGMATAPLLEPGKPLTPEAFELLPDLKNAEIRANGQELARRAEEVLLQVRHIEREAHAGLQALDREAVGFAVGHLLDALRTKYADVQAVLEHLVSIQADLVAHLDEFRASWSVRSPGMHSSGHCASGRYASRTSVSN